MPFFTHPVTGKKTPIPNRITLDGAARHLDFHADKTAGWGRGGWYRDATGKIFMVKFGGSATYAEKLLNDLAKICAGPEHPVGEVEIGHGHIDGGTDEPCVVIPKISDYKDLVSLETEAEKKSHAPKFHRFYVFNTLIANDDLNEENLGIVAPAGSEPKAMIIDYGLRPTFLFPQQIEHAGTPFHLASLIGHRNLNGMQLVRRRYFGHDDFLNPLDRLKPQKNLLKPEDISYLEILDGIKAVVDKKDVIVYTVHENLAMADDDPTLDAEEKKSYQRQYGRLPDLLGERMAWMQSKFGDDLAKLGDAEERKRFAAIKWRLHPEFAELMKFEEKVFRECAAKNLEENFAELRELLSGRSREEILDLDLRSVEKTDLVESVKNGFMMHNALMSGDLEMARWLSENDLTDMNQHRNLRTHNYQFFRLTPLHLAIAIYHDKLLYGTEFELKPLRETIDVLTKKFHEKNGASFDSSRDYKAEGTDDFAVKMTFTALQKYQQKASSEAIATTKIQRAFRAHKAEKLAVEEAAKAGGRDD